MITVLGGKPYQKKYVESIVNYCIDKLMPRLDGKLEITVRIKKNLGTLGNCMFLDDDIHPREFEIEVSSKQCLRQLLTTVAHEMVHVKQYARNEINHKSVKEDTDYFDLPWEIEAHGREMGLFIRWCEKNNLATRPWSQVSN